MSLNKNISAQVELEFIKKEESQYKDSKLYYFFCNAYDKDGMASAVKVKVTPEVYMTKIKQGDKIDLYCEVQAEYLRVTCLQILTK